MHEHVFLYNFKIEGTLISIGIDIIEISRIEKILKRNEFFLEACFSNEEILQLREKKSFYSSVSAHFCAKEAFYKCIGKSISRIEYFKEISVLNSTSGCPYLKLSDKLKRKYINLNFSVSISHCVKYACATVVSESTIL